MTKHRDDILGDKSKNINTLRVTSKLWSGTRTYSGITEDTVLCPAHLHKPDMTQRRRVKAPHPLGMVPAVKSPYFRDESTDDDQLYQISPGASAQCNEEKRISLDLHQTSATVLSPVSRPRTVPLVSWNEAPVDRTDDPGYSIRRGLKVTSYTVSNQNSLPAPRPHTAGPRAIVTPKHNCPAGLTSDDLIRGKQLLKEDSKLSDGHLAGETKGHSPSDLPTDTKYSEKVVQGSHSNTPRLDTKLTGSKPNMRHFKSANPYNRLRCETGFTNDRTFKQSTSLSSDRNIRLELTIMSIDRQSASEKFDPLQQMSANLSVSSDQRNDPEKPEILLTLESKSLDRKSTHSKGRNFRRAQSAPPISRYPLTFINTNQISEVKGQTGTKSTTEEGKKFSNVYWRARSSYHRRNLESNKDVRPEADVSSVSSQLRGSLLRPLMCSQDDAPMKHSAGCPYKCKECFKACLVSEDYVTDSKIGVSGPKDLSKSKTESSMTQRRKMDPLGVVRRALGRSQPLFKQVYGETGGDTICPWPTYAWVDIKPNSQKSI